jgi:hypothetical protein
MVGMLFRFRLRFWLLEAILVHNFHSVDQLCTDMTVRHLIA